MSFEAKIKCDAACCNEVQIDCENVYDVDRMVELTCKENGWLFDDDNDCFYCDEHAKEAAKELGLEHKLLPGN